MTHTLIFLPFELNINLSGIYNKYVDKEVFKTIGQY